MVFAGRVLSITPIEGASQWGPKRVRLAVAEAFRGSETKEIDILLRGGTCDPKFSEGQEYLVYAFHRAEGPGWTTSICTRTRSLKEAGEDLAYLRLPNAEKGESRIVGRVIQQTTDLSSPDYKAMRRPVKGVVVTATDGDLAIQGVTSDDGAYSIRVPPHRAFDVAFAAPPGLVIRGGRRVWIPDYRACAGVDGHANYDGRVSGVLTDAAGQPAPHFPLTLLSSPHIPLGGFQKQTFTDAAGGFEFTGVEPATYVITAGATLWQRDQAIGPLTPRIAVTPSGRSAAGTLTLPAGIQTMLLQGTVVDSAGRAAAGVRVSVRRPDTQDSLSDSIVTDARGHFAVAVIGGRRYDIHGWLLRHDRDGTFIEFGKESVNVSGPTKVQLRLARAR